MGWLVQRLELFHKPTQEVKGVVALAGMPLVLHVRKGHLATVRKMGNGLSAWCPYCSKGKTLKKVHQRLSRPLAHHHPLQTVGATFLFSFEMFGEVKCWPKVTVGDNFFKDLQ